MAQDSKWLQQHLCSNKTVTLWLQLQSARPEIFQEMNRLLSQVEDFRKWRFDLEFFRASKKNSGISKIILVSPTGSKKFTFYAVGNFFALSNFLVKMEAYGANPYCSIRHRIETGSTSYLVTEVTKN